MHETARKVTGRFHKIRPCHYVLLNFIVSWISSSATHSCGTSARRTNCKSTNPSHPEFMQSRLSSICASFVGVCFLVSTNRAILRVACQTISSSVQERDRERLTDEIRGTLYPSMGFVRIAERLVHIGAVWVNVGGRPAQTMIYVALYVRPAVRRSIAVLHSAEKATFNTSVCTDIQHTNRLTRRYVLSRWTGCTSWKSFNRVIPVSFQVPLAYTSVHWFSDEEQTFDTNELTRGTGGRRAVY